MPTLIEEQSEKRYKQLYDVLDKLYVIEHTGIETKEEKEILLREYVSILLWFATNSQLHWLPLDFRKEAERIYRLAKEIGKCL